MEDPSLPRLLEPSRSSLSEHADASPDPYRLAARALLTRYPSLLITEDELTALMLRRTAEAGEDQAPPQLAYACFARALYSGCMAHDQPDRIERAYTDLFTYLQRIAGYRWPASAADITQRAIVLVYEQIACCRSPEAFLKFAQYKLLHAAQQERGAHRMPASLEAEALDATLASPADVGAAVLDLLTLEALVAALNRLLKPRQRAAFVLKYFAAASDEQIGAQLGISAAYVAVLRNRAIKRLRADEQLRQLLVGGDRA